MSTVEPEPPHVVLAKPPKPVNEMTDDELEAFAQQIVDGLGVFPKSDKSENEAGRS